MLSRGAAINAARQAAPPENRHYVIIIKVNVSMVQAARSSRARHAMQRRRHLAAGGRHYGLIWDQG